MDYKKKYKEALDRAKKELDACGSQDCDAARQIFRLFPELAESEDERMKKSIIATIHLYYGEPLEDEAKEMIAWLEKQGEHANFRNKIQIGDKVTRNEDGVLVNLSQLKRVAKKELKKVEQTSANETPYPETLEKAIDLYYNSYGNGEGEFEHLSLEKFRDIVHTFVSDYGQKPAWSEEDKEMSRFIGNAITADGASEYLESKAIQVIDAHVWLDGLKDRVQSQPKQEWSEEDNRHIKWCIEWLDSAKMINNAPLDVENIKEQISWLKSLRPQTTWRPSTAQLNALSIVSKGNAPDDIEAIVSLYNDLKKLKG